MSRPWEVFVRSRRGVAHVHVGSVYAADARLALHHARDLYTRRGEGVSIWVVPAADVVASDPRDEDSLFGTSGDKDYRLASSYEVPEGVRGL